MERACSCACAREAPRRPTSSLRRRGPKLLRTCLCFNKACVDSRICLECVEAIHKHGAIDRVVCVHVRRRALFLENGGGCPNQLKEIMSGSPQGHVQKAAMEREKTMSQKADSGKVEELEQAPRELHQRHDHPEIATQKTHEDEGKLLL